jgi:hypothetical protein
MVGKMEGCNNGMMMFGDGADIPTIQPSSIPL